MITSREVANAANQWRLRHDVVEKDYVLGWLLAGIANHPVTNRWAFKGGTCLRKCWHTTLSNRVLASAVDRPTRHQPANPATWNTATAPRMLNAV